MDIKKVDVDTIVKWLAIDEQGRKRIYPMLDDAEEAVKTANEEIRVLFKLLREKIAAHNAIIGRNVERIRHLKDYQMTSSKLVKSVNRTRLKDFILKNEFEEDTDRKYEYSIYKAYKEKFL